MPRVPVEPPPERMSVRVMSYLRSLELRNPGRSNPSNIANEM
jgi:hypothetical protein